MSGWVAVVLIAAFIAYEGYASWRDRRRGETSE